ncbi:MAG: tyrosine-type recombinase/integrase [Streptosporangiaceae bacterium]
MSSSGRGHVTGPLACYAEGFRGELLGQGYAWGSAAKQIYLMAHVSRWLAARGLDAAGLDDCVAGQFLAARRADGYARLLSARALAPLLGYLRRLGVVAAPRLPEPQTPADRLAARFEEYLVRERALAKDSVRSYSGVARRFLAAVNIGDGAAAGSLTAVAVTGFVRRECGRRSVASAKATVTGMRSLLRFLYLDGQITVPLAGAVPSAAGWQLAALPRAVSRADLTRLLDSCDRRSAAGRRDFAILVLLARLGLRAGEVAALELGDIAWRQGEITVRGKGSRRDSLPLPADAGEAVAVWLAEGRPPDAACPAVFVRLRSPHGRLASTSVSYVVRRACARAGVTAAGAHRLRHAAATQMLGAGGTLAEIGQVLRHALPGTTAIYAKTDMLALSPLARPWPEGQR